MANLLKSGEVSLKGTIYSYDPTKGEGLVELEDEAEKAQITWALLDRAGCKKSPSPGTELDCVVVFSPGTGLVVTKINEIRHLRRRV